MPSHALRADKVMVTIDMRDEAEWRAYFERIGDALPAMVKRMSEIATDPNAKVTQRLTAMELLVRVATGPSNRVADDMDIVAANDARKALLAATPFLQQIIKSTESRDVLSRALELAVHFRMLGRIGSLLDP